MRISGACHCRNIAFELDWLPEPSTIPARACTCSFCRKHGAVWTACAGGCLAVVNVNTFEGVAPSLLAQSPVSFEGEGQDDRLARRKRNWIGRVEFADANKARPAPG